MQLPSASKWHTSKTGPEKDRDVSYELWEIIDVLADRLEALEDIVARLIK